MENKQKDAPAQGDKATDKQVDWAELSGEEDDDAPTQNSTEKTASSVEQAEKKKKSKALKKATGSATSQANKNSHVANNIFVCEELDADDVEDEEEAAPKKEKGASGPSFRALLNNQNQASDKKDEPKLSKAEQKQKEMEELEKALEEFGLKNVQPQEEQKEEPKDNKKPEEKSDAKADGEGANKKKKKKKKTDKKDEDKKEQAEAKPADPVDVEKKIQEIMKKKMESAGNKKKGPAIDTAKQEILARQNAKKKDKKKVDYDL